MFSSYLEFSSYPLVTVDLFTNGSLQLTQKDVQHGAKVFTIPFELMNDQGQPHRLVLSAGTSVYKFPSTMVVMDAGQHLFARIVYNVSHFMLIIIYMMLYLLGGELSKTEGMLSITC